MKICAGMGTLDEYEAYVRAGADEVFAGYIPHKWMERDGLFYSLNRREVLNYNVSLGSRSELEILSEMQSHYQVPVTITLNSPVYGGHQYDCLLEIMEECMELGFASFIIADVGLLFKLGELPARYRERIKVHLSGECGEINSWMLMAMMEFPISRIIFHRKNTIQDMKQITEKLLPQKRMEYEAFALNEMCHFNGAFCNSLHCDELVPACRLPYILEGKENRRIKNEPRDQTWEQEGYLTGKSGCALCTLWKLKEAGITHLKVVSRGNYGEDTVKDIRALKQAAELCKQAGSEKDYILAMKQSIFKGESCSHNCYYPDGR